MRRRLLSVLLTLLIVSSAFVGASGNAAAAIGDGKCEASDVWKIGLAALFTDGPACLISDSVGDQLNATDAKETKTELYGSLSGTQEQSQVGHDSRSNSLTMTKEIALMEAKNAYIRSLNNGSTEATARAAAHDAVEDFYTVRQKQLLASWEIQMGEFNRSLNHVQTEQNASATDFFYPSYNVRTAEGFNSNEGWSLGTATVTYANGSTTTVTTLRNHADVDPSGTNSNTMATATVNPTEGTAYYDRDSDAWNTDVYFEGLNVAKPYADYGGDSFMYLETNATVYQQHWTEIDQQESAVDAEVNTFVNNTYDQWEAGAINESDLIDPYMASREYSPEEDFQSWALMSLMQTGSQTPENMSQFGHMNVSDHVTGETHQGILLSDQPPAEGSFSVGSTYNASTIAGPQFVVTSETIAPLEGEFTVDDAVDADGNQTSSITYTNVTYETTDLTEYKQQIEELNKQIAEINARQEKLRDNTGGGGFLNGDGSVPPGVALGFVAAIVLLALVKD